MWYFLGFKRCLSSLDAFPSKHPLRMFPLFFVVVGSAPPGSLWEGQAWGPSRLGSGVGFPKVGCLTFLSEFQVFSSAMGEKWTSHSLRPPPPAPHPIGSQGWPLCSSLEGRHGASPPLCLLPAPGKSYTCLPASSLAFRINSNVYVIRD